MFGWLKRHKKLKPQEEPLSFLLDHRGRQYTITGSVGLQLVGTATFDGRQETRLIAIEQATDQGHWWRLWRHYNPGVVLRWASDGAEFVPPV